LSPTARPPAADLAPQLQQTLEALFPLCRSLTGEPNRATLRALAAIAPLTVHEVPSGTPVLDWVVPDEWSVQGAWIADADGRRLVDFADHNLHLVGYSTAVDATMDWAALAPKVHVHPTLPDAIPYRTSYYTRDWGFCVTHAQRDALAAAPGPLRVRIDARHVAGSLSYGELCLPGRRPDEILLSAYICHPSMANDSLSGAVLLAYLAKWLAAQPDRQYSVRCVWVPETIGAVTWLARNADAAQHIDMGLVVTCCGGPGGFSTKRSWDDRHPINRVIDQVLAARGAPATVYPFDIHGSDERQYSAPAYRINMASIHRDRYYEYAQYHSSADDLGFVTGAQLAEALDVHQQVLATLDAEAREVYVRTQPGGEVMLSRHDLYPANGGAQRPELGGRSELDLILWLLWHTDGQRSLADVAHALAVDVAMLRPIADRLCRHGVLRHV
jgi:aminopeptidase-like protein